MRTHRPVTAPSGIQTQIRSGLLLLLASALLSACDEGDQRREITRTRKVTPKAPASGARPTLSLPEKAPPGWVRGPEKSMRLVTYRPEGRKDAECYVTVLAGKAGGVAANLDRWRAQVGQPPLTAKEREALRAISVLGRTCKLLEAVGSYTDTSGTTREGNMLLGVVCPLPGQIVTVKMTGPAETIRAETENFVRFCESLREGE